MQLNNTTRSWPAIAAGALLAVAALPALAQSTPVTAEFSVKGTIVPPACQARFDAGKLDFGSANIRDFPAGGYFDGFTTLRTNLTVTCPSSRAVSFSVQDMKAGTQLDSARARGLLQGLLGGSAMTAENEFGLGTASINGADVKLGSYAVLLSDTPTIDGAPMYRMGLNNGATIWSAEGVLRPMREYSAGTRALIGGRPLGNGTPVAGRTFIFPLTAAAVLNMPSELQVAQDATLDGQLVFALQYP